MDNRTVERLEGVAQTLDHSIQVTQSCNLQETTRLLMMARLDLQLHIHNITDDEFRALCEAMRNEFVTITAKQAEKL